MTYRNTRLHSSRMRTSRLLPVSLSMHCDGRGVGLLLGVGVPALVLGVWSQGGSALGGVSAPGRVPAYGHGRCLPWGVLSAPGGACLWSGGACFWPPRGIPTCNGADPSPHVNRMTERSKNIILLQTSFAGGKNTKNSLCLFFKVFLISSKTFLLRLTM